jgi:hypothetical protein
MMTFYVATLSTYVLVDAETEDEALQIGAERIKEQFGRDRSSADRSRGDG